MPAITSHLLYTPTGDTDGHGRKRLIVSIGPKDPSGRTGTDIGTLEPVAKSHTGMIFTPDGWFALTQNGTPIGHFKRPEEGGNALHQIYFGDRQP